MQRMVCAGIGFLLLLVAGCASPIGTRELPPETFEDGFRRTSRIEAGVPILNNQWYFYTAFAGHGNGYIWDSVPGMTRVC